MSVASIILGGQVDSVPDITSGALRGVVGPLAKVPFTIPKFSAVGSGSSASLGTIQPNNPDGRNQQAVLTCGAGAGCYAGVKDVVYGPVVGLRIPRTSSGLRPPFDVEIDGAVYPVDVDANPRFDNVAQTDVVDFESLIVVAVGLEDKPHTVKVHIAADVSASPAARTVSMFGWLAAQGRGYHQPPQQRTGGMASNTPTTMPTTATQVPVSGLCTGLSIYNGDAATRVVTVTGPDGTTPYRKPSIAAGDTWAITFPSARTLSGYKWSVDSTANVKGWVEVA